MPTFLLKAFLRHYEEKRIIYVLMKTVQDFADRRKQATDDYTAHAHCMLGN